jgi:hypothetical protein
MLLFPGLPAEGDVEEMKQVWQYVKDHSPKPMTSWSNTDETSINPQDDSDSMKPYTDYIIDVSTAIA